MNMEIQCLQTCVLMNVYQDILGQGDLKYPEADIGVFVHLKPRNWSSDLCSSKNRSFGLVLMASNQLQCMDFSRL